jgi:NAD(P)-dependent dehydrogenase (short-subunit alcohol dehydrogenase family)
MSRVWLITGSSRGIGREIAKAALAAGNQVVATARDAAALRDLVDTYPDDVRAVSLDVTDGARADEVVCEAVDSFGRLDVVVNNAGYANIGSIEDFTDDDFRAQIETNLWDTINVTRAALPVLREQRSGHIIQLSSVGGRDVTAGLGPYQTAKWAVEGFSGVLQKEVQPLGIHVTLIEPGGFRTDWAGSSMTMHPVRDEYQPSVGAMAEYNSHDTPVGDPAKAAQAILRIADEPQPPLRLLLGSDAYALARAADRAKIESDEHWKDLTLSTDHDDADLDHDALGRATGTKSYQRTTMSTAPLIFIATNRLKPGAIDAERARVPDQVQFLERSEPRLIAFHEYANADGTEVTVVQVHPDAESMTVHLPTVQERAARAYEETLDATVSVQIFGEAAPGMLESLEQQAGTGVAVSVMAEHLGGFTRARSMDAYRSE